MAAISSDVLKVLMESPALSAPSGFTPSLSNTHSLPLPDLLAVTVCLSLCTTSVAIRLYTRLQIMKKLWWDDCKLSQLVDVVDLPNCVKICPSPHGYVPHLHYFTTT